MNQNELKYFQEKELQYCDATSLPLNYLLKSLLIKLRRKTWGRVCDKDSRMAWMVSNVSDAMGTADNVRNYLERKTLRAIISKINNNYPINSACEIGCGYGRVTMVLSEFAKRVVGFEREKNLVDIAKSLLPTIEFYQVYLLDKISYLNKGAFDFTMTCTVLQHLTDIYCHSILEDMKRLTPNGYVLLIEKTESIAITKNTTDENLFISRARSVEDYANLMKPYKLVSVSKRIIEPTYFNPNPGSCMLFRSPLL